MTPPKNDPLLTYDQPLAAGHTFAAFQALAYIRRILASDHILSLVYAGHQALSVILHSYSALEATVNYRGHQLLFSSENPNYIPPAERDIALDFLAKSWPRMLQVPEKVKFVIERAGSKLPPRLETDLRELGLLRNWICHGVVVSTTLLVSPSPLNEELAVTSTADCLEVWDRQDSIDWVAKFPNTRFQSFDRLGYSDGFTALRITLECIVLLIGAGAVPLVLSYADAGEYKLKLVDATTTVTEFIEDFLEKVEKS
jgi:hypothetical protein